MTSVAIFRPALHKIIHRYGVLSSRTNNTEEQEWVSGDETEEDDNYSVYSDEYITQEDYSEEEADESDDEIQSLKRYRINLCTATHGAKRRKY